MEVVGVSGARTDLIPEHLTEVIIQIPLPFWVKEELHYYDYPARTEQNMKCKHSYHIAHTVNKNMRVDNFSSCRVVVQAQNCFTRESSNPSDG